MFIECNGLVFDTKNVQFRITLGTESETRSHEDIYVQADKEHPCYKLLRNNKTHNFN